MIAWFCRQLGKEEDDDDIVMGMDEEQVEEEKTVSLSEQKVNQVCNNKFIEVSGWR